MIDYHDAIKEMHKGNVVKYVGTVNGNVWSDNRASTYQGVYDWLVKHPEHTLENWQ